MKEKICYAYKNGKCKVLKVKECDGERCAFLKTAAQVEEDQKKVFKRISSLNPVTRNNIMVLYYGGKMSLLYQEEVDE